MSKIRDHLIRMGIIARGMFRSEKLTRHANGAPCMHCTREKPGAVVAAHSNWPEHDKGGANKAHDCFTAFLCDECHMWIDQLQGSDPLDVWSNSAEDRKEAWRRAHDATMLYLFMTGKVKVM